MQRLGELPSCALSLPFPDQVAKSRVHPFGITARERPDGRHAEVPQVRRERRSDAGKFPQLVTRHASSLLVGYRGFSIGDERR